MSARDCRFCDRAFYTREDARAHEPYCQPWEGRGGPPETCCPSHAEAEQDRAPGEVYDYDGIDMTGHEWAVIQNDNMTRGNAAWRKGL